MEELAEGSAHARGRALSIGCAGLSLGLMCLVPPLGASLALRDGEPTVSSACIDDPDCVEPPPSPALPATPVSPAAPSAPAPMQPLTGAEYAFTADVQRSAGLAGVQAGTECSVRVERRGSPGQLFRCHATVRCGSHTVYGRTPSEGLFDCTLYESPERHVVGSDPDSTDRDGDPQLELNTLEGTLSVEDAAVGGRGSFTVHARIRSRS